MIAEGEEAKQVLHKLPLKHFKVSAVKETNQGFGISPSPELL